MTRHSLTDKAKGVSGWSYLSIQSIFFAGTDSDYEVIADFFQDMFAGKLARDLWATSKSVLIPKKDPSKPRPLGIGESFYRIMGKIVVGSFREMFEQSLAPLQLGCGVPGGAEIVSRVIQLSMEADPHIYAISLDMINAFPSVRREQIYEILTGDFSPFRSLFAWMYGGKNTLYDSKGNEILEINTGLMQGDPLSSLFFCLAFQPTLESLLKEVETGHRLVHRRGRGTFSGKVVAFMDDVTLLVHGDKVKKSIEVAERILNPAGFRINKSKTVVVKGKEDSDYDGPEPQTAAILLGNPIGHDKGRKGELLKEKGDSITSDIELVERGDIHRFIKFSIIRSCLNTRSGYLDRVNEPYEEYTAFCKQIDAAVDRSICSIAEYPLPAPGTLEKKFQTLRDLPQKLGGLGIGRHNGWAGEKARTLSRALTRFHVWEYYSGVNGVEEHMDHWKYSRLDDQIDKFRAGEKLEGSHWDAGVLWIPTRTDTMAMTRERDMDRSDLRNQIRDVTARLYEASWKSFVEAADLGQCWQAWFRSSAYRGSGRWLAGMGHNMQGEFQFIDDKRFLAAFRFRLLIEPETIPDGICPLCGEEGVTSLHHLDCSTSQWFWTNRHNIVRDLLAKFIEKVTGKVPVTEFNVATGVTADIMYKPGEDTSIIIDVTIANPAAKSYSKFNPHLHEDAVAKDREDEKMRKYNAYREQHTTLPFVIETTGRFGPAALKWLRDIKAHPELKSRLRDQIRSKIWQLSMSQVIALEGNIRSASFVPNLNINPNSSSNYNPEIE